MTLSLTLNLNLECPPDRMAVTRSKYAAHGTVLWCSVGCEVERDLATDGPTLEQLGLQDAPVGISIWEGDYESWASRPVAIELVGEFRPPTDEEWAAIRARRNPFDVDQASLTP